MVMQAMRSGTSSAIMKYIFLGLLMMATLGLVFMDVTGAFSGGGVGNNDVARIGHKKISIQAFDRNLRRTLSRVGIPPQEAYKLGYVEQFLNGEIRSHLMAQAAADNGILIDNRRIAAQIREMIAPMIKDGQKPGDVLKQILMNQEMTEKELAEAIGREMTNELVNMTVKSGFETLPDDLVTDLYKTQNEKRDIEYIAFMDKDYAATRKPTDEELQKFYEVSKESYSKPEMRVFQILKIKDDNLKKTLRISDEELKQAYEDNIDSYSTPAQHTLEQALVDKEEEAKKIYDGVKAGSSLQEAAKSATGRESAYLGEKVFGDKELMKEIQEPVLKAESENTVLEPVKTPIGWYVVKVKKISPLRTKAFEEVKAEIRDELLENKLADEKYALTAQVDDLAAGGSSPEEIASQADVQITDLPSMNSMGLDEHGNNALKAYENTGSAILESGFKLLEGETSPVRELSDRSFVAVHLKSLTPKSYMPFEDVKADLEKRWMADNTRMNNRSRVAVWMNEIKAGKKTLQDVAKESGGTIKKITGLQKNARDLPAPLTSPSAGIIFNATENQAMVLGLEGGAALASVVKIEWPEKVDPGSKEYKEFKNSLVRDTTGEAMALLLQHKNDEHGSAINVRLLEKVYGSANQETP